MSTMDYGHYGFWPLTIDLKIRPDSEFVNLHKGIANVKFDHALIFNMSWKVFSKLYEDLLSWCKITGDLCSP